MGKSKHPGLLPKAKKDVAGFDKYVKKDISTLKKLSAACGAAQSTAKSTISDYNARLAYLKDVIGKYIELCSEIVVLEEELAEAKGDRKKEAEVKKKLKKAEKTGDGLRADYNLQREGFFAFGDMMQSEIAGLVTQADKLEHS